MGTAPGAVLVRVRIRDAVAPTSTLPKFIDVVEDAMGGVPVPVSVAVSVFALDLTVRVPVRAPRAVGLKATSIWHVPPAATEPQEFEVTAKSPLAELERSDTAKMELFFQTKLFTAEVKPTGTEPKSAEAGVIVGAPPSFVRLKRLYSSSFS
jgi:hypothetical protein